MRPSTRRSMSRAAALFSASWWRACAPGGRCACPGHAPAGAARMFVSPEVMISQWPAEAEATGEEDCFHVRNRTVWSPRRVPLSWYATIRLDAVGTDPRY